MKPRVVELSVLACLALFGCAQRRAVSFQGHAEEPRFSASQVIEVSSAVRGAKWLGRVTVRCRSTELSGSFDDRPLFDLDCSDERLRFLLRVGAAEAGGDLLSDVVCTTGSSPECRALVSRLEHHAAVLESADLVHPELRESVGNVRIGFVAEPGLRPRASEPRRLAGEQPRFLPSHERVGCLRARCESCSETDVRDALLVAGARLGGADVVGARCTENARGRECVAELMRNERD